MPKTFIKRRIRIRANVDKKGNYYNARTVRSKRARPSVVRIKQRTIPDKMMVKLPYADLEGINGSGGFPYTAQKGYNINGLYDPETGTLNQQNLGFQQYMSLYNKYRVYKVDYDVTIVNTALSVVAGSISFGKQGEQVDVTDVQQLQVPYSRRFTLGLGGLNAPTSKSMIRLRGSIYLPRTVGKTSEQYRTNDVYIGTKGSNPSEIIQMSINAINVNNGVQATLQVDVRYTCHVELFDRDTSTLRGTDAPVESME